MTFGTLEKSNAPRPVPSAQVEQGAAEDVGAAVAGKAGAAASPFRTVGGKEVIPTLGTAVGTGVVSGDEVVGGKVPTVGKPGRPVKRGVVVMTGGGLSSASSPACDGALPPTT